MITTAILTISDKGSQGKRDDYSGPAIEEWVSSKGYELSYKKIIPDEIEIIKNELLSCCSRHINLILTTGGTGLSSRDVTPEATKAVIDKEVPGFSEIMRSKSFEITPHAVLSRGVSGIKDNSLIINLPGSPKAVKENLSFIEAAVPHAIDIIKGRIGDCAEPLQE